MKPRQRRWHSGVLAGLACGGLAAGHVLAYLISVPGAAERHDVLISTGHSYAQGGLTVAVTLAIISCAALIGFGFARGIGAGTARPSLRWAVTRAILVQVLAFVLLESLERILAGAALGSLFGLHLFVGVGVQFAIGAAAGFLFIALDRAGQILGSRVRPPAPTAAAAVAFERNPYDFLGRTRQFATPRSTRAPPIPSVA